MKYAYKFMAVGIAAASLAVASVVFAHPGTGMGPMGGMPGGFGHGGHMAGGDLAAAIDAHMGDLKSELKITAAQEPAWQAFIAKAKQQAQAMQTMRTKVQEASGSAPDRMAQRTEFMKTQAGNMETMSTSLKELYAVLTPEQKATADKRFGMMGGRHMAHGPRGG